MIQKVLSSSPDSVLAAVSVLRDVVLIYSAHDEWLGRAGSPDITNGSSNTNTSAQGAYLYFDADEIVFAKTRSDLRQLAVRLKGAARSNTVFDSEDMPPLNHTSTPRTPHTLLTHSPLGWAGYFTYESGLAWQNLACSDESLLAAFGRYSSCVRLDFASGTCTVLFEEGTPESKIASRLSILEQAITQVRATGSRTDSDTSTSTDTENTDSASTNTESYASNNGNKLHSQKACWAAAWDKSDYQNAYERVQAYLNAGDCYQVNLTMPYHSNYDLTQQSPDKLLKSFNPRFGGYCNIGGRVIFSVSPERFISIVDGDIQTRPIKGTSARHADPVRDEQSKQWLAESKKNQAENLMIVDLLRNDLSIHAEPHSVAVSRLFDIESHANVHHMVSTIDARLLEGQSAVDVIFDALPGGSITGAPKRRAMEIISELECAPRGVYCGSMGVFTNSGDCDFNILIRTIEATSKGATCSAGGGIVVDSQLDEEWQELQTKVQRLLDFEW